MKFPLSRTAWIVLLTVFLVSLFVGVWPSGDASRPTEQRITHLAQQIRCPTCAGLSAAESEAPLAQSTRNEIERRVGDGQTDSEIKAYFVSRYGDNALMSPKREGVLALAWLLPIILGVFSTFVVVFVVLRWRTTKATQASDEDRKLVTKAMRAIE